jgi:predicted dehydrogenase
MTPDTSRTPAIPSRRDFLKSSTVAAVAGGLASSFGALPGAYAAGSDILKVGLIGCGGRGSGAATQALAADPNVRLTAMGDAFIDRLQASHTNLKKTASIGSKVDVAPDHQFVGFDAYQKVIDSGVDVVILATPTQFRPMHLKAAVAAGKHVFCEKPVAVDGPGIRSVIATCAEAKQKGLSLVSGLCWRYDNGMRETFRQVRDGAIGDIRTIQVTYLTSTLKKYPRQPEWSDMEFQVRNWNGFYWLSGDFNVEQHVHSLDKMAWAMGDQPPVRCTGVGGRQARTGAESGNVYDHFSVVYEYPNGVKGFATCRQMDGCSRDVSDHIFGTKGVCDVFKHVVTGENKWKYKGPKNNMYQTEHDELFASIRSGKPINNGEYMTRSTLLAIMGRMSAYTGQVITWEQALNSKEDLSPAKWEWGPMAVAPVAVPGVTQFV